MVPICQVPDNWLLHNRRALLFGSRANEASGDHEFDMLCDSQGIEHRLTKPRPRPVAIAEMVGHDAPK